MASRDESPESSDMPAGDTERPEGAESPVQRRMLFPPTGWAAMAAWSYWRHNPWGDPPPLFTVPAPSDDGAQGAGARRDDGASRPGGRQPDTSGRGPRVSRRRRVLMVIVIEALAALGVIGAIVSAAVRAPALGISALGLALVANAALWLWARTLRRRATASQRDTSRGHP